MASFNPSPSSASSSRLRQSVCLLCRRATFQAAVASIFLSSFTVFAATPLQGDAYDRAVALRAQLEATPAEQRMKAQYEEALNAFRAIYHQAPSSAKAPASVAAVADLLAEKGRVLKDSRALRAAIGQYEFLREQYPKSPQVENALLLEGEICRQDLKDAACAEEKFRAVIETEPGTSFAEQAALELKALDQTQSAPSPTASRSEPEITSRKSRPASPQTPNDAAPDRGAGSTPLAKEKDRFVQPEVSQSAVALESATPGRVVRITGMRHWSNPTSTRIAIDLGGKVEYEAARVPNPDRIFFDLNGTKLTPGLNGHTVEVVDDGYLKRIRAAQFHADVTRVVLDVTDVSQYSAFLLPNPWRLIIDIHGGKTAEAIAKLPTIGPNPASPAPARRPSANGSVLAPKTAQPDDTIADVARLSTEPARIDATAGPTSAPVSSKAAPAIADSTADRASSPSREQPSATRSTGKSHKTSTGNTTVASESNRPLPHAADPTADGQRSLVRALGLKVGRIVIDAGHGGHDSGTLGPGGIQEKDVVLDVALRTGKLLHQSLGAEIVYTRDDDTFIPLETRTAIANKAQADLFLSIHGNSSPEPSARGVETYYLNFTSDPNALDVAARENAVSTSSVHQLSDLVRKITLKDKIDESREFAADVDASLYSGLKNGNAGLRDRGVKKAPFVVLIGAQMPSILAEISFLTNPDDAELLREGAYRQRIAESLAAGVEHYLRGLSGPRPADEMPVKRAKKSASKNSGEAISEGTGQ